MRTTFLLATIAGVAHSQTTCAAVKAEYRSADCCGTPTNNVSALHACESTAYPVQWTKVGILGSKDNQTKTEAKISLSYVLNDVFYGMFGKTWSDMQTQSIQGVPEQENTLLEESISSHTVKSAQEWYDAQAAFMFDGCTNKQDAVDVCVAMYNDANLTTHTQGGCTMARMQGMAFGIVAGSFIEAFHYDEWLQIHVSDAEGILDAAWRDKFKHTTYVSQKCKAVIAETQWHSPPISTLGLQDARFEPRIVIYGGATDTKKVNKFPCVSAA